MITMRFTSLKLGFLFTFLVLSVPILHSKQATMLAVNRDGLVEGEDTLAVEQELFGGVSSATEARSKNIGGRKMVVGLDLKKEIVHDADASKISGANHSIGNCEDEEKGELNVEGDMENASHKSLGGSQKLVNNKDCRDNFETEASNSESTRVVHNLLKESSYEESHDLSLKREAKKLLEAAREIVNMMHKDYGNMGKRKPPINNYEPLNEEYGKP